ncbi:MAG TPA: hypothetical protein PKE27_00095 [Povalibacter sp.]|uniref:hypothetical protein n=1 Tax=Povalibacter sp. TaxID=1962978 RepID=UPI002B954A34|nr:hypothetical protein [Povalibacter sp.]HMN42946.1 hypothetical protein [Povalibacter sp.]
MPKKKATIDGLDPSIYASFDRLVSETSLDEVFYPMDERGIDPRSPFFHPLHPEHVPPGGLLAIPLDVDIDSLRSSQTRRVAEHLKLVKQHSALVATAKEASFKAAARTFQNLQTRRTSPEGYRHARAEFRFLRIAILAIGSFRLTGGYTDPEPTAPQREAAARHIDSVVRDIQKLGVGFHGDPVRTLLLEHELRSLKQHADKQRRRTRRDSSYPYRAFIARVAEDLHSAFGNISPGIVKHLAQAVGSQLGERVIEMQLAELRRKKSK